jgi:hypothetical protein
LENLTINGILTFSLQIAMTFPSHKTAHLGYSASHLAKEAKEKTTETKQD